jgi:hypothetical protein
MPAALATVMHKELLAAAAILLTIAMYVPYIRSIRAGQTKPHAFSWIIWSLSSCVIFLAQLSDYGGAGAWPIGVSAIVTIYIAVLAYINRTDTAVTRTDWIFLAIAVAALPCWLLTSNPLFAVLLLTGVELVGFGPTFRVAFRRPYEEHVGFYLLGAIRSGLTVAALEHYSWTTALFPAAKGIVGVILVVLITYRRMQQGPEKA